MRAKSALGRTVLTALVALSLPIAARGQGGQGPPPAATATLSMPEAVRLALERNQSLLAQRLATDASKADEITAALKPNLNVAFGVSGLSIFSPKRLTFSTPDSAVGYDTGLSYTFERGGKRESRMTVARDATELTTRNVMDAERQLRFQTEQAFVNVLLAKSTLDLAQQNLQDFSQVVDINQGRVASGDLAEGDFLPISIQKLQFETDASAAEVDLVLAKAALRQLVGFDSVPDEFDVTGALAFSAPSVTLDDLKREALTSRPDLLAAQVGVKLARNTAALERTNRARDLTGSVDYTNDADGNTLGVGVSMDLPFHDRNQGNIAHADVAVRQAEQTEAAVRFGVLTDVTSAFAAFQTSAKVVRLYESGYLDQASRSLTITTYAFQRGASSLLNLLDAERTSRDTQLAYRQALAALMTSVRQVNFAVGKQVMP
jgi:outer membrane protein, heavy metal efflux system